MKLINLIENERYFRYIVELDDGNIIEFSDNTRTNRQKHWVICVPTQIGCPVGCFMCGSWKIPYKRSLTAEEIIDLVNFAVKKQKLNPGDSKNFTISFLGIGEPAFNIKNLEKALKILIKTYPCAKLIISSVGIKFNINSFLKLAVKYKAGLQFSLLNSNNTKRGKNVKPGLMNRLASLEMIANIGKKYYKATGDKLYLDFLVKESDKENPKKVADELNNIFYPVDCFHISINIGAKLGNSPQYLPPPREVAEKLFLHLQQHGYEVTFHEPLGVDNGCGIITQTNHF